MPATVVKASELLAAIADRPAPGDVLEVEPGTVTLGPRTVTWSGDFEVRPRTMPPDVLGPAVHGGANMPVKISGSLAVKGGLFLRGFDLDSLALGSYGPGTLLLSGACDVEDVRIASRHIGFTAGQFADRAKGVRMKRVRLENIGIGGSAEAKYRQAAYIKAVDPGGFDLEDFLIYGGAAYSLHHYPNSVGAKSRRGMCIDNAWGIIYSGELGNTSTGGSGSSHDNGVHATIVAALKGNANGTRRAIESWWGGGAAVGTGNVFGQGAYDGGATGSGYSIVESIQAAPKRLNPNTPGDYRQAPDSPTRHLGPLSLRPGGTTPPPAPPPSTDPCASVKVERDAARAEVIDLRTARDAAVMARLAAEAQRDDAIAQGLAAANRAEDAERQLETAGQLIEQAERLTAAHREGFRVIEGRVGTVEDYRNLTDRQRDGILDIGRRAKIERERTDA